MVKRFVTSVRLLLWTLVALAAPRVFAALLRRDRSRSGGRTARPGRRNTMTHDEVRAFAARNGIAYPALPKRMERSRFGIVTGPLMFGQDPPILDPKADPAPVVADARRAAPTPGEAAPPDPHARAPGDFGAEDFAAA
jgi:hypothetical protein